MRSAEEAAVLAVEAAYDAAWAAGDVAGLLACLSADAVLVNPRGQTARGHAEIRRELEAVLRSFGGASTHASVIDSVSFVTEDVAVVDGHASIVFEGEGPGSAAAAHRFTDTLVRRDGRWVIAHVRAYPSADFAGAETAGGPEGGGMDAATEESPETRVRRAIAAIAELVHRETRAWDTRDLDLLLSVFHPDMVWPWPPHAAAHDPLEWVLPWGRYDAQRWRAGWGELFSTHELVHNRREVLRIEASAHGDGGFAVVDVDTLWRDRAGNDFHWFGRACKIYTQVGPEWKLIAHTGLLEYPGMRSS